MKLLKSLSITTVASHELLAWVCCRLWVALRTELLCWENISAVLLLYIDTHSQSRIHKGHSMNALTRKRNFCWFDGFIVWKVRRCKDAEHRDSVPHCHTAGSFYFIAIRCVRFLCTLHTELAKGHMVNSEAYLCSSTNALICLAVSVADRAVKRAPRQGENAVLNAPINCWWDTTRLRWVRKVALRVI